MAKVLRSRKKCPECGAWNDTQIVSCDECSYSFDRSKEGRKRERDARFHKQSRFTRWLASIEHSEKRYIRVAYRTLYTAWVIYMGIVAFFAWLIAWFAG